MKKVHLRFYEELNDFLPVSKRKIRFETEYLLPSSVKDFVEAIGVPHTEIDLILANGKSVGFDYIICDGDDISVYPEFESFDISKIQHLRAEPLRSPKFILDVHLGKLARYMRLLGFDTLYRNNYSDDEIVKIAAHEKRTVLTRDKGILKRKDVNRGYWLRNTDAKLQVEEIMSRFQLGKLINAFSRCITCNGELKTVSKDDVIDKLPSKVKTAYSDFFICSGCNKVYWMGTHYDSMKKFVSQIQSEFS